MKINISTVAVGALIIIVLFGLNRAMAQSTERVSVDSNGIQGNGNSYMSAISANGQYIVFSSESNNLVTGDTNNVYDLFIHDRLSGITERVSVDSAGNDGNGDSWISRIGISLNGRYVSFESKATNLVANDTNAFDDIFVRDRENNITERVSVNTEGIQGNDRSLRPSISSDGRYVAFHSFATNLVDNDNNNVQDIFVHDRENNTTERVSVDSNGVQANEANQLARISSDGRYVAFLSYATNLVSDDTNGAIDIFVHDRETGATERVSEGPNGEEANERSMTPAISSDGRYVAYHSWATNLVDNDINEVVDVFVYDRQTDITEIVSVSSNGAQGDNNSYAPSLSSDGRYVTFHSFATNLAANDTNEMADVFMHDRQTNTTEQISVGLNGTQGNGDSMSATISTDGRYLAFESEASNLVADDTNSASDIFLHRRSAENGDTGSGDDDDDDGGDDGFCFISLISD